MLYAGRTCHGERRHLEHLLNELDPRDRFLVLFGGTNEARVKQLESMVIDSLLRVAPSKTANKSMRVGGLYVEGHNCIYLTWRDNAEHADPEPWPAFEVRRLDRLSAIRPGSAALPLMPLLLSTSLGMDQARKALLDRRTHSPEPDAPAAEGVKREPQSKRRSLRRRGRRR